MSGISIIVPYTGERQRFEDTLASLLRHRPKDSQLIVVHDGAYSDPYGLSDEVQFLSADHEFSLIQYLNVAMCYVGGQITVVVRAGIEVDENWESSLLEAFEDPRVGSASPVIVGAERQSRIVAAGVDVSQSGSRKLVGSGAKLSNRRLSKLKTIGPSSWFASYRTSILKQLLPFDEQLDPVFWDADVASAIRAIGFRNELVGDCVAVAESEDLVLAESETAHGLSAQRFLKRSGNASLPATLGGCLVDLCGAVIQPWKLKHLTQRTGAGKHRAVDNSYYDRLATLRDRKLWLQAAPEESTTVPAADYSYRRAA